MNTEMEKNTQEVKAEAAENTQATPNKAEYMERIKALPAEDQAFMDGFLFAKVTSRREAV